jgi:hypothetical protein
MTGLTRRNQEAETHGGNATQVLALRAAWIERCPHHKPLRDQAACERAIALSMSRPIGRGKAAITGVAISVSPWLFVWKPR